MAEYLDVTSLLRDLTKTIPRFERFEAELRRDPEAARDLDPFEPSRWVTTRDTLRMVTTLGDPASPYLAAWVYALLEARVNRDARLDAEAARHAPVLRVTHPAPAEISLHEALSRLLRERAAPRRHELRDGIERTADEASARMRELWSRRGELEKRLALSSPEGPLSLIEDPRPIAMSHFETTEDLAREAFSSARTWDDTVALALSSEPEAPWPRRLSIASLSDFFRGEAAWLDVPDLVPPPLPAILGASSFTRAFASFGATWADAASSRELPRPLARHPLGLERRTLAALFAHLLSTRSFLSRVLGFSALEIDRTVRSQARTMLLATRLSAARVMLRDAAFAGDRRRLSELFEEHVRRAFRAEIPAVLALVMPRLSWGDVAEMLALGRASALATTLRDRFDHDWFRNPEAVRFLRHDLSRAPLLAVTHDDALAGVARSAKLLEARLAGRAD